MAIIQAFTKRAKQDFLRGVHQPGDIYAMALYTSAAELNADTEVYTTSGEVVGAGYSSGGQVLVGFTVGIDGSTAFVDFDGDPTWPGADFTARGALIYNASKGNVALAVYDFGTEKTSSGGNFTVTLPAPAAGTAMIRIS
jgi:hypothetical protein